MSEIASRVKAIIVDKLGVEESEVTIEASFTNDLGADSLTLLNLSWNSKRIWYLYSRWPEKIGTVGDAVSYIEEHAK